MAGTAPGIVTEAVPSVPRLVPAAEPLPGMPTPPPQDPDIRLSFSRVDTYERCPLMFRFRYLDKLPSTPSPDLSWGSAIHAALEVWWSQKLPSPPPVEVLYRALYDHWEDTGFADMDRERNFFFKCSKFIVMLNYHLIIKIFHFFCFGLQNLFYTVGSRMFLYNFLNVYMTDFKDGLSL
jgi:hypothetical protein